MVKQQKPKGMAVAAMVCGICGIVIPYIGLIIGIIGFILGLVSLSKIKKGKADGKGMAIAGVATGAVTLALFVLGVVMMVVMMGGIALPALQRSQRDTQRRDDYAWLASIIYSYQSNHSGMLPSSWEDLAPQGSASQGAVMARGLSQYKIVIRENSGSSYEYKHLNDGDVFIEVGPGYDCSGYYKQNERFYRILGYLESGSTYCQDNS